MDMLAAGLLIRLILRPDHGIKLQDKVEKLSLSQKKWSNCSCRLVINMPPQFLRNLPTYARMFLLSSSDRIDSSLVELASRRPPGNAEWHICPTLWCSSRIDILCMAVAVTSSIAYHMDNNERPCPQKGCADLWMNLTALWVSSKNLPSWKEQWRQCSSPALSGVYHIVLAKMSHRSWYMIHSVPAFYECRPCTTDAES